MNMDSILENPIMHDQAPDHEKELADQDEDVLCCTSSDSRPSYDSEDEKESGSSSISSDSSSESSVVSETDSSDLSSPITCVPWMEQNITILNQKTNIDKMETPSISGGTSASSSDRKRKEHHESSTSLVHDSKVIRAIERDNKSIGNKTSTESRVPKNTGIVDKSEEITNECVNLPIVSHVEDDKDNGTSIPPISLTEVDSGMRVMPINFEPEIQRQWERTVAQWHSRKLRRPHRPRHYGRSSKSFSDAEDIIRSNYCNLEELTISNSKPTSASVSVSPFGDEVNVEMHDLENIQKKENDEDLLGKANLRITTHITPLPLLDFSTLHHQVESEEPISYAASHSRRPSDQVMLSPRNSITVTEGIDTVPPSPPIHQFPLDPPLSRQILEGNQDSKINTLSREITSWKKQLKTLEEEHARLLGYKASHADKVNHREMRKCLIHISKAKLELKQIREDPSAVAGLVEPKSTMSANSRKRLEDTVSEVEANMLESREIQCRSEDPILMNPSELMLEKSVMQKQLLMLERRHGRPSTKDEKAIVRKLYDRYRIIKKMSSRFTTVKENSLDLVPILEYEALDLQNEESREMSKVTAVVEIKKSPRSHRRRFPGRSTPIVGEETEDIEINIQNEDYNEMDLNELERHYRITSDEKRKLRLTLRTLEGESPGSSSGRLQQKEEKTLDLELIYQKYKHTRATLRLLDVLINKRKYPNLLKDIGKTEY